MPTALRDYQEHCVTRTLAWLGVKRCNPLIVVPTGGGKSLIIAELCRRLMQAPNTRIILAAHVKELVEQIAEELHRWWPKAPLGICSAGLGSYNVRAEIVVGTVQTLYRRDWAFGKTTHMIVDEAHMISRRASSRYQKMISNIVARAGRHVPVIGATATPFRLDSGLLHKGEDALFDIIASEVPMLRLVRDGYLVALDNRIGGVQIDTSKMLLTAEGDYRETSMEAEVLRQNVTSAALDEAVQHGASRNAWLVFAVSVAHANLIAAELNAKGISAEVVSHDVKRSERERIIQAFRQGKFRALVSVNILTAGFNVPHIDMIVLLRPTLSTGLYIQMLGRGMRIHLGKSDCVVLDFGGNIERHGPMNSPKIQRFVSPVARAGGQRPLHKHCPMCDSSAVPVFARACPHCAYLFAPLDRVPDLVNPVLDFASPDPEPMRTPAQIIRDFVRVNKVEGDPFLQHLFDLRE